MNFQELLMRLSASSFAADRPDYDWKTLRLFPETGLDLVLIVRLAAALILCVIGALVHNTVVQYILLALSALAAGYDYLASAIACILDRQVFRPAVIVIVCVIGTMAVGQPVDAAVFLLVYRVMSILIAVVTVHAQKTLEAAVGGRSILRLNSPPRSGSAILHRPVCALRCWWPCWRSCSRSQRFPGQFMPP